MTRIRDARPEDRAAIGDVHVASIRGIETAYDERQRDVWAAGAAATTYPVDDSATALLVAECDGSVVGLAEASVRDAELEKLYVAPSFQGRGIATALSEAVDERLRAQGVDSVTAEASVNAVPFYERVDYERTGTHRKTVRADGRAVEMELVDVEKRLR